MVRTIELGLVPTFCSYTLNFVQCRYHGCKATPVRLFISSSEHWWFSLGAHSSAVMHRKDVMLWMQTLVEPMSGLNVSTHSLMLGWPRLLCAVRMLVILEFYTVDEYCYWAILYNALLLCNLHLICTCCYPMCTMPLNLCVYLIVSGKPCFKPVR